MVYFPYTSKVLLGIAEALTKLKSAANGVAPIQEQDVAGHSWGFNKAKVSRKWCSSNTRARCCWTYLGL